MSSSLQRVKELLALNIPLGNERSKECFEILFGPDSPLNESNGSSSLVGEFVMKCDSSFLCAEVIPDLQFWELFKESIADSTSNELGEYINRILKEMPDQSEVHRESYLSLCQAISSDNTILDVLVVHLSTQHLNPQIALRLLNCIIGFLKCFVSLSEISPSDAAHVIPSFLFMSLDTGLWDTLTSILAVDDLRIEIVERLIPVRKQLFSFLKSSTIDDYETPVRRRLLTAINDTINTGISHEKKFEETTEFQNFSTISLLQAFHITAFLENTNLSFKKTLAEQILFGNKPFPLFYASIHVCDSLGWLFEKLESGDEDGRKLHTLSFLLNEDQFMYALMDRLLKTWVESQAATKTDLDTLLELIPITFERIRRSISSSLQLPPQGYLHLALDVIKEVNYKLSRELQLDTIKELRYETWSIPAKEFDIMLSNQVHDYVHHQRLLQLQKGTWVYAENPVDPSIKSPKVYFIILSANQINLLVREYSRISEHTPFIEDNELLLATENQHSGDGTKTLVIPLNRINNFNSYEISLKDETPQDSHLVNVIQKNFYTEVELMDENHQSLLKVYFDTKEAISTWLDGMQLVCSAKHTNGLSQATVDQIDTLIDIRKSVQMINLAARDKMVPIETDSDDEEYYDLRGLKQLTTNFYYE